MKLTDKIEITNEDNMELMARYPDNYFDLAIVDPPYGLGDKTTKGGCDRNSQVKFKEHQWDDEIPNDDYFKELFRVSKNQIIWGGNYFPFLWKKGCRGLITWDKMVYIPTMSQIEYAWYSKDKLPKLVKINNNDPNRMHPTQKPKKLYEWLLMNYAKDIDCKECDNGRMLDDDSDGSTIPCEYCNGTMKRKPKILDTHLGSGSIAIAAHNLGYELTACELDEDYYEASIKRIQNHIAQQRLF